RAGPDDRRSASAAASPAADRNIRCRGRSKRAQSAKERVMVNLESTHFPEWSEENNPLRKPPVGNKQMFPTGDDFITMVVGGPNQRTDYHVDPYEEFFYQIKGTMHVDVMTDDGPGRVDINE